MERRFAVHAGAAEMITRAIALACVLATASTATAAPKGKDAKAAFDQGVAAYTKGDYTGAAEALEKSAFLEPDAETLFAWAQTERKLDRCDKATELYTRLLAMDLPAENKQAIEIQVGECKAILDAQKPVEPARAEVKPPTEEPKAARAWWMDPIGGGLVGAGVVGLGLGVVFLVQARNADADKPNAATYPEFEALDSKAESRGRLGVISMTAGAALIAGGIVWYATQSKKKRDTTMTGWLAPSAGGLAVVGSF